MRVRVRSSGRHRPDQAPPSPTMSTSATVQHSGSLHATLRRPWIAPACVELPPLEQLTLQTGTGIPGDCTINGQCPFSLIPSVKDTPFPLG